MSHHPLSDWFRFGARVACVAGSLGLPVSHALAEDGATRLQRPAEAPFLKHMPASHDLMTFRGESSSTAWPVFLNRNEAAQITTLQLGLFNTVSALPERSVLRVSINGRPITSMPIKNPDRIAAVPVRIPAGLLVPGFNAVQVDVTMAHRVDCSVKASFELWTLLDPDQTGFVLPRQNSATGKTLNDLAGEPLAADGTTRIHVRLPDEPGPVAVTRAAELIGALTVRAHLLRTVVDVGPEPGTGSGFDLVLDGSASLGGSSAKSLGQEAGLTLYRDPGSNRLTVAADVGDAEQFDASLEAIRRSGDRPAEGSAQGLQALTTASGIPTEDDRALSFADLGVHTVSFTGRHLVRTLGVILPRDFYPGNYGTVRLYIDGDRVAGLTQDAALVFRVNGALVSSLPLGPGSPDRLDHALVNLPLQFFRPGYNAVELEGTVQKAADDQCVVSPSAPETRLTVAETSELVLPHLARMQTLPQIASTLQSDRDLDAGRDIYLTGSDRSAIGVGLTMAANMAAGDGSSRVRVSLDQPVASDRPGIVIGPFASLPDALATPMRRIFVRAPDGDAADQGAADAAAPTPPRGKQGQAGAEPLEVTKSAIAGASRWLRSNGFFFNGIDSRQETLPVRDDNLLVADVTTREQTRKLVGLDVPHFSERQDRWLVVTGASNTAIAAANATLVANGRWRDLAGEAVSYDPKRDVLNRLEPTRLSYVIPKAVALGDVQPILGGIVSSNILISIAALLLLLSLLGLSTHTVLALFGTRKQ